MIIYVDVLLFLNTVVNYIMISLVGKIARTSTHFWRRITAAFIAALFSLYIFLPPLTFAVELVLRLLSSVLAVLIAFGVKKVKVFLRNIFYFYLVSFLFFGLMIGIWFFVSPNGMALNNGVVYFNISPLVLITASFIFYVVFSLLKKLLSKEATTAKRCKVVLKFQDKTAECNALIDSGHSLCDAFSDSTVIVIDRATSEILFGSAECDLMLALNRPISLEIAKRFRLMPVKTVSGDTLMSAVRLDGVKIMLENNVERIEKVIAVLSDEHLGDDYSAIISAEVFDK